MKPCSSCGDPKELSEFHKNKNTKDGRQSICKSCSREYRIVNRVHIYERVKKQFLGDPEKRAERAERTRRWREANPEKAAEQARRREEKRKEKRSLTSATTDPIVVAGVSSERADA